MTNPTAHLVYAMDERQMLRQLRRTYWRLTRLDLRMARSLGVPSECLRRFRVERIGGGPGR
jgi:hypothetical protein